MQVGVAEAASRLGVSDRRVRALIEHGDVPARSVSGRWVLDEADLVGLEVRRTARPMSARVGAALLDMLSGEAVSGLAPSEVWRLRRRCERLLADPQPAALLRAWMRDRPRPRLLSAAPADLTDLAADPRVVASGVSDVRSQMAAVGEVEAWVSRADLQDLCKEYLLVDAGASNVTLRVAEGPVPSPVPLGWLAADLAEHRGPREEAQVVRLLQQDVTAP